MATTNQALPVMEADPDLLRTDRLFRDKNQSVEIGVQALEHFLVRSEKIADEYFVDDKELDEDALKPSQPQDQEPDKEQHD
ncbi:hypothetical protein BVRB_027090 [Beta vulgaris subsp. vulgaris]|uniref:Uncharacterized protein n=1 Tax=Beta vulgaris subsp. vulgaris TaxID=3555 RepID=A0A0J8DSY3_BETVV|nr:hypothetical protein BVRB_027090 [Beta vulgaris subsp. vulgaris]